MYTCNSCGRQFQRAIAAYSNSKGEITTSDSPNFEVMSFAHEEHSWYYCPYCGSDQITDHEELDDRPNDTLFI